MTLGGGKEGNCGFVFVMVSFANIRICFLFKTQTFCDKFSEFETY